MNAATQTLLAIASVAAAAAIGVALADRTAAPTAQVVKLERVVVVGKRMEMQTPVAMVKLPRVVIEQRRAAPVDDVKVAQAQPAGPAI